MIVPFLDVAAQNRECKRELSEAFGRVAAGNSLILGPEVAAFEQEWAAYCGAKYAVGVGNGLDALRLILKALGIDRGDEVIVPANTYIATWMAVSAVGAWPVPVDVNCFTWNVDPGLVAKVMTYRTKAIIAVNLYGMPADFDGLQEVAAKRRIPIIVDAAQSHGVDCKGLTAAYSFYPTKNLGALGDGGAVVTDDQQIADSVRRLRNYGSIARNVHTEVGCNSRLDEVQAAFLRAKLLMLDVWNGRRRDNAAIYEEELATGRYTLPMTGPAREWHQYVIAHKDRDALRKRLAAVEIGTDVHYPTPPHLQPVYAGRWKEDAFPIAEALARDCLSLPIGPELTEGQVRYVAEEVRRLA